MFLGGANDLDCNFLAAISSLYASCALFGDVNCWEILADRITLDACCVSVDGIGELIRCWASVFAVILDSVILRI